MINASAQFIRAVQSGRTDYKLTISMLLKNGGTLTLTEDEIWGDTAKIEDATAQGEDFTVGAFVSTKFSFSINNMDGTYTDDSVYDFIDAELTNVSLGLELGGAVEYISLGRFWVDSVDYNGSLISFVCTDRARLFNRPYQSAYNSGTATLRQLLTEAVVACTGSSSHLMSEAFPNETYAVKLPFSHDSMTYADLVAMVAQLAGCFAKFDNSGVLRLAWYPVISSAIPASSRYDPVYAEQHGYHVIKSLKSAKIQKHDCVITKITVTEEVAEGEPGTASYPSDGADDYVIAVSGNRLISAGQALAAARAIRQNVNDRAFRPLEVATLTNPLIEAGDVMYVVTNDGSKYFSFVTSRSMLLGSGVTIQCAGTPAAVKSQTSYTELSKAIAKEREQRNVVAERGEAARAALENSIYSSLGLHYTEETAPGGGVIKYYHDGSTLEGSKYIWKFDADSITVSSDGGATWSGAFDARGNALLQYLAVDNLDADWINAGTINADLIKAGILSDATGHNYWNLQTGDVHFLSIGETIVSDVEYEYGLSNSATTAPTSWSKSSPAWTEGKYIWQRTTTVYSDGTSDVNTVCIQGIKGADGRDGAGVNILGSYNTLAELQAAHPTGNAGDAYFVGSDLCVWDAANSRWKNVGQIKGDKGDTGDAGANGVSVTSITPLYAINADGDHEPAYSAFTTTIPEWQEGKFIWSCVLVGFSDGTAQYSTRVVDGALNTVNASYHEFVNNSEELRNSYEKLEHYVGYSVLVTNTGDYITTSGDMHIGVMFSNMSELLEETTRALRSELQQTAESITAGVAESYETKTAASTKYQELNAGIQIHSDAITSAVERIENVEYFAVVSHLVTNDGRYIVTDDSTTQNPLYLCSVSGSMLDRLADVRTEARSYIDQTADNITQTVEAKYVSNGKLEEARSQIDQRADGIELSAVKKIDLDGDDFDIAQSGRITINPDKITSVVEDELLGDYSTTEQTAQAISSAVAGKVDSDDFTSYQVQVKNRIDSVVAKDAEQDKLAGIYGIETTGDKEGTIVTANGDRITAFIGDIYDRLHIAGAETATAIQQTEDKITAVADSIDDQIAAIEIEANRITSRVEDAENNVSIIRQTADELVIDMSQKVTKGDSTVLGTGLEWTNDGKLKFKLSDVIANIKNGLKLTIGDITDLQDELDDKLALDSLDNDYFSWTAEDGLTMTVKDGGGIQWTQDGLALKIKDGGGIQWTQDGLRINVSELVISSTDIVDAVIYDPQTKSLKRGNNVVKLATSNMDYDSSTTLDDMLGAIGSTATQAKTAAANAQTTANSKATLADAIGGIIEKLSTDYFVAETQTNIIKLKDSVVLSAANLLNLLGKQFTTSETGIVLDPTQIELAAFKYDAKQNIAQKFATTITTDGLRLAWNNLSGQDVSITTKRMGGADVPSLVFTDGGTDVAVHNKLGTRYYQSDGTSVRTLFSPDGMKVFSSASNEQVTIKEGQMVFQKGTLVDNQNPVVMRLSAGSGTEYGHDYDPGVNINYADSAYRQALFGTEGLKFYGKDANASNRLLVTFVPRNYTTQITGVTGSVMTISVPSNKMLDIYNENGSSHFAFTPQGSFSAYEATGAVFNNVRFYVNPSSPETTSYGTRYYVATTSMLSYALSVQTIYPTNSTGNYNRVKVENGLYVNGTFETSGAAKVNSLVVTQGLSAAGLSISGSTSFSSLSVADLTVSNSFSVGSNTAVTFNNLSAPNGVYFQNSIELKAYTSLLRILGANGYTYFIDFHKDADNGQHIHIAPYVRFHAGFVNDSDARLKKNISPSTVKALEALTALDMKSYDWIKDDRHVEAGIIAQQLQKVAPELVVGKDELAISTTDLLNYCVKAIQELAEMVGYKPKKKAEWTDPYTLEEKLEYVKQHTGG